MTNFVLD